MPASRRRAALASLTLPVLLAPAIAACGDDPPGPGQPDRDRDAVAAAVEVMLQELPDYITTARATNEGLIPGNPPHEALLEAKIAMLDRPGLTSDIASDERSYGTLVTAAGGGSVPIAVVFPLDTMRLGAMHGVEALVPAVSLLEAFFDEPLFTESGGLIRIWYGFALGTAGGGAVLQMEDRGTYEARTPSTRVPWDAILGHVLAHSYIGHESLTQFLELFVYNVVVTGSEDVADWVHLRGYTPFAPTNADVHALLDVYQLIGRDAMATVYRQIRLIVSPYGVPLGQASKQEFVGAAPGDVEQQVADLVDRIAH